MLKTKRSGLLVILSLVMVLSLSCGAWADSISGDYSSTLTITSVDTIDGNVTIDVTGSHGLNLGADASADFNSNGYTLNISVDATSNQFAIRDGGGSNAMLSATGNIYNAYGYGIYLGLYNSASADVTFYGSITTGIKGTGGRAGAASLTSNTLTLSGDVTTFGDLGHGLWSGGGIINMSGSVTTWGVGSVGLEGGSNASGVINMTGTVTTYGAGTAAIYSGGGTVDMTGDVTTWGDNGYGVRASYLDKEKPGTVNLTGNLTVNGVDSYGLAVEEGASINMTDGTITVSDDTSWAMAIDPRVLGGGGSIDLTDVTATATNLLFVTCSGDITAANSTLTGDVLQDGTADGTLNLTLIDSEWTGAAEASGDIGTIDINLTNSAWYVTASSDTNGRLTDDADSLTDFNGTTDNITVEIGSLGGDFDLNIKIGDTLIIKDGSSIGNITSSNPDVIEIVENADGSISIISKGDGNVKIEYQYVDGGSIKTGTIGVSSGTGSSPSSYSSGGSSGCNAGFGALFTLLGLAFVVKRK